MAHSSGQQTTYWTPVPHFFRRASFCFVSQTAPQKGGSGAKKAISAPGRLSGRLSVLISEKAEESSEVHGEFIQDWGWVGFKPPIDSLNSEFVELRLHCCWRRFRFILFFSFRVMGCKKETKTSHLQTKPKGVIKFLRTSGPNFLLKQAVSGSVEIVSLGEGSWFPL